MSKLNWDEIRIFLAVARSQRLQAAARQLQLDHSTVSRRIDQLEQALGMRLLERSPRGTTITEEGRQLMRHAEKMEAAARSVQELKSLNTGVVSGVVRVASPEAFGLHIIARNLPLLRELYPALELELIPEFRSVSLSRHEADVAISFSRPRRGNLVSAKLTDYRLGLFAAPAYLERAGVPATLPDLASHQLIGYIDDLTDFPALRSLARLVPQGCSVFRSSSIMAQEFAVRAGVGIGLLHRFSLPDDHNLVPVLPDEVVVSRSYWITTTTDDKETLRIRAVTDFIRDVVRRNRTAFCG